MKPNNVAKTFAIAAVAILALTFAPNAKAERKSCSAATLKGTWSQRDNGFVPVPSGGMAPFAGLSVVTFDGTGALTSAGVANVNGTLLDVTSKGTYKVNGDCTGTYTSTSSTGRTGSAYFVIVDGGNEIHILPLSTGAVITCVARRQFAQGDSLD